MKDFFVIPPFSGYGAFTVGGIFSTYSEAVDFCTEENLLPICIEQYRAENISQVKRTVESGRFAGAYRV